jgi:DNA polymerase
MPVLYWDYETRSAINLRDAGAYIYSIDSTTDLRCMVYAVDDGEPQLWLPTDPVPEIFNQITANPKEWVLIAHNYGFERAIYDNILIPRYGFPSIPLASHDCSQRLALSNAYPAELDLLAQALGLPYRKDPDGRKAMLAVSRPKTNRKRKANTVPTWDNDPVKLQLTYERCKLDVITTRAVWLSPKLKHPSDRERHYQIEDAIINARGVRCDRAFITAARDLAVRERIAINLKLQ